MLASSEIFKTLDKNNLVSDKNELLTHPYGQLASVKEINDTGSVKKYISADTDWMQFDSHILSYLMKIIVD